MNLLTCSHRRGLAKKKRFVLAYDSAVFFLSSPQSSLLLSQRKNIILMYWLRRLACVRGGFGRASVANKGMRECSRESRFCVLPLGCVHIRKSLACVYTPGCFFFFFHPPSVDLPLFFASPSQTYHNIRSYLGFSWVFVMQKAQSKSNWHRISESGLIVSGVVGVLGDNERILVNGICSYCMAGVPVRLIHP